MNTATPLSKTRAERIKEIRLELGLTQRQFADRLGVEQATVSRWERGAVPPSELNRWRLARLGGVHPNYLRGEAA